LVSIYFERLVFRDIDVIVFYGVTVWSRCGEEIEIDGSVINNC